MNTALLLLHSYLRWILLILLLVSIVKSFSGFSSKKALTAGDKKLFLFTMVSAHISLLVGLYLILFGRYGAITYTPPAGTKVMKDSFLRFFWVEHPVMMIIAITLITIGRGQVKKSIPDAVKYKKVFWFFLIALVIILAAIPWPGRFDSRPLFPGI